MGYELDREGFPAVIRELSGKWRIFAPVRKAGKGRFTDTDVIIYDEVKEGDSIELEAKSDYSFKEVLTPLSETLFYFTESHVNEAELDMRPILVFLRSCDLHALKRQDQIYLENGTAKDPFYQRRRDLLHFALIGCTKSFDNCFCVSMGTNHIENGYDFAVNPKEDGGVSVSVCEGAEFSSLKKLFSAHAVAETDVSPAFVSENTVKVSIPAEIPMEVLKDSLWDEYTSRCIGCGRCNFVCPTCTCYTMQDVFYTENGRVGERRRVAASCMVDGFTNVAGGGQYRRTQGERMRFKVLHKICDHRKRFRNDMCVGCGRCDDVCPEYISYSNIIHKVAEAAENAGKENA
ncbi:MAG: anaerobic sulfite reductase subunit AsrA [Lachnospiraceae bacterium]|jgi:anaerobic sulfite reductase subunit A|nr:anaerobic sulfite reductase subunit AsrA [Lachnospiraceae bacterium]MEE3461211.1 anaerobic sulfite reductase subunit AsrA [Lachnospiraceae bacterium]